MAKRFKFQCWNCPKVYFYSLEITGQQEIIVTCPYCSKEAVVDLRSYRNRIEIVLRGENKDKPNGEEPPLPDIFPTKKPN